MTMTTPTTTSHQLGELQLAIMQILWQRGEASAADVHAALYEQRGLAFTTIATMLAKMEQKGVVTHRAEGRKFIYRPLVSESEVRRSMVDELRDRLFGGNVTELVSHLLSTSDLDPAELARLKSLIAAQEKKQHD
jgi:BlaI family transcriptional regulator, penicillinase repressor